MGRGSAYSYRHFMLIDMNHESFQEYDSDGNSEFCEVMYEDFLHTIMLLADASPKEKWVDREARIIFSTNDIEFGIDSSGGLPALFARLTNEEENNQIEADRIITESFNKFIGDYMVFRRPTSAWTSEPIHSYFLR